MNAQRGSIATRTVDGFHHRDRTNRRMDSWSCTAAPTSSVGSGNHNNSNQNDVFFTPRPLAPPHGRPAHQRYDQQQSQPPYDHAFFTARRSTDAAHGSSNKDVRARVSRAAFAMDRGTGNESDVMETARDTARSSTAGFETDDYMSAFEPDTSRVSSHAFQVPSDRFCYV